ncbi:MAG: FABP family protein [Beutenbergiaceae bacterium]
MTFSFPEGLAPEIQPLAWLVGRWRGPGFVEYPDITKRAVVTEAEFDHDGGPYLSYRATTWLLDGELTSLEQRVAVEDLHASQVWAAETGYWRATPVPADGSAASPRTFGEGACELEVLLADPSGHVDVFVGRSQGPRINLATDVVARTSTGADITASSRIYGLVSSELFWAWDLAAFGHELQSYASGRMQRLA